mgnify:CR=1 FL=1
MSDRYIVENEFDHDGYKCVVIFGASGYRCGYVGVPKSHPLYGKKYSDYLKINKRDIEDREVSGIFPLLSMILDSDEILVVGKTQNIQSKVICGGSDLTVDIIVMEKNWNLPALDSQNIGCNF